MRWPRNSLRCALAVAMTALAGCSSDDEIPPETLGEAVTRLTEDGPSGAPSLSGTPSSYRIEFARYTVDRVDDTRTVGGESKRRRPLDPIRYVRAVIRPFDESGDVTRTLGFVREAGAADSRVTFVRPVPDDPRPLVYPPSPGDKTRQLVIAGRDCRTTTVRSATYCIDGEGLILMTQTKQSLDIATKVSTGNQVKSAADLTASLARGFTDVSRGSIRPIHPDTAPAGTDWSLDGPPAGFVLVGRYAVAPLTSELLKGSSRKVTANIVDVYVRGADAVIVERGGKLDLTEVGDEDIGSLLDPHDVELGALGRGRAGIGGIGPFGYREVRAFPARGKYVVVAGTLPEDELVAIARSLKSWPGTAMRYLDAP